MEEIKKVDTEHLTADNYVNMISNEVEALRRMVNVIGERYNIKHDLTFMMAKGTIEMIQKDQKNLENSMKEWLEITKR